MEDWHLGNSTLALKAQDHATHANRKRLIEQLFLNHDNSLTLPNVHTGIPILLKRGSCTGQCHYQVHEPPPVPAEPGRSSAWELSRHLLRLLREAAKNIPVRALLGYSDDAVRTRERLIPALMPAFIKPDGIRPSCYLKDVGPLWFSIDAPTAEIRIVPNEVPLVAPGTKLNLSLKLVARDHPKDHTDFLSGVLIGDNVSFALQTLGKTLVAIAGKLEKSGMTVEQKKRLQAHMAPIMDFQRGTYLEVPFAHWATVVSEAAQICVVFATCHMSSQVRNAK